MKRTAVIGIPRYLSYFSFGELWERYFEHLGFEVTISPPSNQDILDEGVRETVNDACIPIKLFHGHVKSLRDKADYLFVPRLGGTRTRYTVCPKFLGLPDMVKYSLSGLPEVLAPRLDVRQRSIGAWRELVKLGVQLTGRRLAASRAFAQARRVLADKVSEIQREGLPALGFPQPSDSDLTVGVVGYPYVIYDHLANGGLLEQLLRQRVSVRTPELVTDSQMKERSQQFPKDLFWFYSNRTLWSGLHFMDADRLDGLVHVTAFGCGPDAMVGKLLEMESRQRGVPFLSVMVDEHTGEAGVATRAEAFVDMLRRRLRGGSAS